MLISCERACASALTFYFTLKAVSVLLGGGLLVRFLLVLLGALAVVVHPFNSILLHRKIEKGFTCI